MDADWDEVGTFRRYAWSLTQQLQLIPHMRTNPNPMPEPISIFAFDYVQELLWVGSRYGRVLGLYGPELQRYTSYLGHRGEAVKQILFHDKGVISLSRRHLHMAQRTGLAIWHLNDPKFHDLQCMTFTKGTNEVVLAGVQDQMFKVDIEKGQVTEYLRSQDNYSLMKRSGMYVCAANCAGAVHIMDPSTMRILKVWQAHRGTINDMDAKADFLVTCGLSPRPRLGLHPDPLANVFDLRTLTPLPPIPFQPGAAFVRMHPKMSTTSIVASLTGQLQVVDIMNPHTVNLRQANIYDSNFLTGIDLAPTGEALALASSMCQIHLWGSPSRLKFTEYGQPTVFPDNIVTDEQMDWTESPLNTVGMPYYRDILLSAWPAMISEVGGLPPKIDMTQMKRSDIGYYANNTARVRPNVVEYTRLEAATNTSTIVAPKFLSQKARDSYNSNEEGPGFDALASMNGLNIVDQTHEDIPNIYKYVEIKYSKFGVDDFDFEFYNKTKYSGLETHIANSYANPLLQLYRFIPILRNIALWHTSSSCVGSDCMLCELGFLVDMLEKASGQNCQASNFLKTMGSLPTAASLNLLEEQAGNTSLTLTMQNANRFLLDRFVSDMRRVPASHSGQTMATKISSTIRCAHCNAEQMRPEEPLAHDLVYPSKLHLRDEMRQAQVPFSQALKASIERPDQMRAYCPSCRRYQQLHTTRNVQRLPTVLVINASIHSPEARQTWAIPNWLPQEIGVIVDQGQVFCYQGQDLQLHVQRGVYNILVYELVGVVCDIAGGEMQTSHPVSVINVALSSREVGEPDQWHLFNDFLVQPIPKEDALKFDPSWKRPSVIAYQLKSSNHHIDDSWKKNLDTSLLFTQVSPLQTETPEKFSLLTKDEAPKSGTPVGIDAEFVSLGKEEIEIKADGTRETVRPSRLGLARVSVLRGDGPCEYLPFIDDYIATTERIVDYLTAYSGIRPGDLDPTRPQSHVLVTLKIAYKKLWLLLNLGCVFVGHGLLKDFRTINLHVPRVQVVDTVDLWFIRARARKLNLRFLAWLLLDLDVQGGEAHDSVEDATTALRLRRKYDEVVASGDVEETLEWVYRRGREAGFRAPAAAAAAAATATTTASTATAPSGGGAGLSEAPPGGGTPVKKVGFGREKIGFGSPMR